MSTARPPASPSILRSASFTTLVSERRARGRRRERGDGLGRPNIAERSDGRHPYIRPAIPAEMGIRTSDGPEGPTVFQADALSQATSIEHPLGSSRALTGHHRRTPGFLVLAGLSCRFVSSREVSSGCRCLSLVMRGSPLESGLRFPEWPAKAPRSCRRSGRQMAPNRRSLANNAKAVGLATHPGTCRRAQPSVTAPSPRSSIPPAAPLRWRARRCADLRRGSGWTWFWVARRKGKIDWSDGSMAQEAIRRATLLPAGKQPSSRRQGEAGEC